MADEKKPVKKSEYDKEATRRAKEEQARRGRRRFRQLIGLALGVLMIVGAVSIVQNGIGLVKSLQDDTSETDAYTKRVAPLVWFDILPFESLSAADPNALKQAVVWGVLNETGKDELEYDELGRPLVPAVEMDRYAAELFGPDYKLEHGSFEDPVQALSYDYDPVANVYAATSTSLNPPYIPTVVNIERLNGGIKKVTVGYVSTMNSNDELIATPDLSNPSRYMDYFFRRDGNEYYLYAMRSNNTYTPPDSSSASSEVQQAASLPEDSSLAASSASGSGSAAQPPAQSGSASLAEYDEAAAAEQDAA